MWLPCFVGASVSELPVPYPPTDGRRQSSDIGEAEASYSREQLQRMAMQTTTQEGAAVPAEVPPVQQQGAYGFYATTALGYDSEQLPQQPLMLSLTTANNPAAAPPPVQPLRRQRRGQSAALTTYMSAQWRQFMGDE